MKKKPDGQQDQVILCKLGGSTAKYECKRPVPLKSPTVSVSFRLLLQPKRVEALHEAELNQRGDPVDLLL